MKKLIIASLVSLSCIMASHAEQYFEGNGGLGEEGYGVRLGQAEHFWDASLGYLRTEADGVDLHTVGGEGYLVLPLGALKAKLGLGLGLGIPNFPNGGEKGDTAPVYTLAGGVEYALSENWSIGTTLRALFIKTDTHVVSYGSHDEVLSTGQHVEVLDIYNQDAVRNLNHVFLGVSLRYYF